MSGASVPTTSASNGNRAARRRICARALERQIAAEAQMHALIDEGLRLLEAAVERSAMPRWPGAAQSPDDLVLRFAHMAKITRQIELPRDLFLAVVEELLPGVVEASTK